jgi:hypothetical protein
MKILVTGATGYVILRRGPSGLRGPITGAHPGRRRQANSADDNVRCHVGHRMRTIIRCVDDSAQLWHIYVNAKRSVCNSE